MLTRAKHSEQSQGGWAPRQQGPPTFQPSTCVMVLSSPAIRKGKGQTECSQLTLMHSWGLKGDRVTQVFTCTRPHTHTETHTPEEAGTRGCPLLMSWSTPYHRVLQVSTVRGSTLRTTGHLFGGKPRVFLLLFSSSCSSSFKLPLNTKAQAPLPTCSGHTHF